MPYSRSLLGDSIPTLINGVSQQSEILRLPNQVEEQINCISSLSEGVSKRPPTEFIKNLDSVDWTTDASLSDSHPSYGNQYLPKVHVINRDDAEKYIVVIKDSYIEVFDLYGVKQVTDKRGGAESYIDLDCTESPKDSFRAHTIADTTFIVNKNEPVAMAEKVHTKGSL